MAGQCWQAEEQQEEKNYPFLTKKSLNKTSFIYPPAAMRIQRMLSQPTFCREERLKSKKIIDRLFSEGNSFNATPFRIVWEETSLLTDYPIQAGFTVSSRSFSKATDRNRIKRLIREAYRMHKTILFAVLLEKKKQVALMFVYAEKKILPYPHISEKMLLSLKQLAGKL